MKRLNNKGYMLVEIILAFAITFALIYFIMDLVINLKNKNDDLMVSTLVTTDQTIITNKLMNYAIAEEDSFSCEILLDGITENSVKYGEDVIDIVNEHAVINKDNVECSTDLGRVSIRIPIDVKQIGDEDFDVVIDYKYDIGDMIEPTCSLSVSETTITADYSDNEDGSGIDYYGWSSLHEGNSEFTSTIDAGGEYVFYVTDKAGNENTCSVDVKVTDTYTCSKSALSYSYVSCSASNYNSPSSACSSGKSYSWNTCSATVSTYKKTTKKCFANGYAGSCKCRLSGNFNWTSQTCTSASCSATCSSAGFDTSSGSCYSTYGFGGSLVTGGYTSCSSSTFTCNAANVNKMYIGCAAESYTYSGSIACSYYSCSTGTRNDDTCYLYDQASCSSDWNSEMSSCASGYSRINGTKYCYKIG